MKGAISELDDRISDLDIPNLVHGATSTMAEMAEVVVQEIVEADEEKANRQRG